MIRNLTFNEKLGLGIFILFLPAYFVAAAILKSLLQDWRMPFLIWGVAWALITFLGVVVAVASVFLRPDFNPSTVRRNVGRFVPLVSLALTLAINYVVSSVVGDQDKIAFASAHSPELRGPPPLSVIYSHGIPDGGNAIIRSPDRNPERFAQSTMIELTGERIRSCDRLTDELWSCHFD